MKHLYFCVFLVLISASCTKKSDPAPVTVANELATVRTDSANQILDVSAHVYGTVVSEGGNAVTAVGIAWGTSPNPTTFDHASPSTGFGVGPFSVDIEGLQTETLYYARAYATNAKGTQYGNQIQFTTHTPTLAQRIAHTWKISSILQTLVDRPGVEAVDELASWPSCGSDNLYVFKPDGAFEIREGATKCISTNPDLFLSGTWTISSDNQTLSWQQNGSGNTWTLVEVTDTRLVGYQTGLSNSERTRITWTFSRQ